MYYPSEISRFKIKLIYLGRSTNRFVHGQTYEGTYVFGEERGWKAHSLDYLVLSDGYRILPYEEKRFFKWAEGQSAKLLNIMYGRGSARGCLQSLVYSKNPFLELVKNARDFGGSYYPIPVTGEE